MATIEITSRMRWIVNQLKSDPTAYIKESRNTYTEESIYWLHVGDTAIARVTEPMLDKLCEAGLIVEVGMVEVRRRGEFVTNESVYCLPEAVERIAWTQ